MAIPVQLKPEQIGAIAAKVGVTVGLIVTSIVVDVAHCPASGVNVYVPLWCCSLLQETMYR